jgi:hypothetical protein
MDIRTLGIDLAKNLFRVHGVDAHGRKVVERELRRRQLLPFVAQLRPCLVGMEACGGAHYWAREIAKRGHGRKIGFTNRTLWPLYQPMWARMWAHTVHYAVESRARLSLTGLVQPRIEPEVVFKLAAPVPGGADVREVLAAVPRTAVLQPH